MTQMLVKTDVVRYLEFKQIAGSYVFRDGKISKVPSNESEALRSSLMGLFEKRRARNFFLFLQNWKDDDPTTHQGLNLDKNTMKDIYTKFGLEAGTQDFVGHAMALHLDDDYLKRPARDTYERILLYTSSMARYGKSPYIYPMYGLGELPQAFARLSAIYGGTYMLAKPIEAIVTDDSGKFVGVTSEGETVKAKMVIGDPSYFQASESEGGGKVRVLEEKKVVRAICILKHPVPGTDDADSAQIIIPQNQVGRKNGKSTARTTHCFFRRLTLFFLFLRANVRHLHRRRLGLAPRLCSQRMDRDRVDHCRDVGSGTRVVAWFAVARNGRRQVSVTHKHTLTVVETLTACPVPLFGL